MKALTLRHPWPFAVAFLGKDVENRDWDDSLATRLGLHDRIGEQIGIHGSSSLPRRGRNRAWRDFMSDLAVIRDLLGGRLPEPALKYLHDQAQGNPLQPEHFLMPGIVAVTTITHATRSSRSEWAALGQLHLLLADTVVLPRPISDQKGDRGFWDVPEVVAGAVRVQLLDWSRRQVPPDTGRDGAAWLG